jgi:predicted RNase H-like nuclease (RuvC/YqgF family)
LEKFSNNHEKDAFCAGLQAYRSVKNKIKRIDLRLEEEKSRIIRDVIKGTRLSQALPIPKAPQVKKPKRIRSPTIVERKIDGGHIIQRLEQDLKKKEGEIQTLLMRKPESSKELNKKEAMISRLHRELDSLQKGFTLLEGEYKTLLRLLEEVSSGTLAFVKKEAYTDSSSNKDWSSFNTVYTSSPQVKKALEEKGIFVRLVQGPIFFNNLVFFSLDNKDTTWLRSLISTYKKR